jgi:hypothetical protein
MRAWIPLVLGFLCLVAALFMSAILALVLIIAGLGLMFDGATVLWERAGGRGNLGTHRQ